MEKLQQKIDDSDNIVFFGGAGVSTESGVPDFRSQDGLYHQQYAYPPEMILSHSFFIAHPDEFYRFYKDKLMISGIRPNAAHLKLAELEAVGKLRAVITQNIDGLHQAAGSQNVLELHGSIKRNYCLNCGKLYDDHYIFSCDGIPRCSCGGMIKPDVVLYEEPLNQEILDKAIEYISRAEVLIVGGTSLTVYPAAGLLRFYKGSSLVLINRTPTRSDGYASLIIRENIGKVLGGLKVNHKGR